MNGNPTAGIVLLLVASLLIVLGVTDKGKQILSILFGTSTNASEQDTDISKDPKYSGSPVDPDIKPGNGVLTANYPGAFVGEKGANRV